MNTTTPQSPTFFSSNVKELSRPVGANVLCHNAKSNRYCYAVLIKDRLYTGFCFGDNDYHTELEKDLWKVVEQLKSDEPHQLEKGDIIELTKEHCVYAMIPKHLAYANRKGDFSLVEHNVSLNGEFSYLQGKYLVLGFTHAVDSHIPKIVCQKLDGSHTVSFYQKGHYNVVNKNLKPTHL